MRKAKRQAKKDAAKGIRNNRNTQQNLDRVSVSQSEVEGSELDQMSNYQEGEEEYDYQQYESQDGSLKIPPVNQRATK